MYSVKGTKTKGNSGKTEEFTKNKCVTLTPKKEITVKIRCEAIFGYIYTFRFNVLGI